MPNDRQETIMLYLKSHNMATVEQLVKATNSSPATIRRDLIKLDQQGSIIRTHGGVALNQFIPFQPTTNEKQYRQIAEKERISDYAASLILPGSAVILDAGTTTLCIAKKITHIPLRVITTDLHIALLLSEYKQIEVIMTGGRVDASSQSCIGNQTLDFFRNINPDFAFVSCNSWSLEKGITAPTEDKAALKRLLLNNAKNKILVADSSKYGKYSLFSVTKLTALTGIITDSCLSLEEREKLVKSNLDLIVV